jgi:hypothetical protein
MTARGYFPRVAICGGVNCEPFRHVHREAARLLVSTGIAEPRPTAGRVREIVLITPASISAKRVGPPSPPSLGGVRFTRWRNLDESAVRILEHHPRCLWIV